MRLLEGKMMCAKRMVLLPNTVISSRPRDHMELMYFIRYIQLQIFLFYCERSLGLLCGKFPSSHLFVVRVGWSSVWWWPKDLLIEQGRKSLKNCICHNCQSKSMQDELEKTTVKTHRGRRKGMVKQKSLKRLWCSRCVVISAGSGGRYLRVPADLPLTVSLSWPQMTFTSYKKTCKECLCIWDTAVTTPPACRMEKNTHT